MRSIAVALCMAALAGAAGMVDVRSDSVVVSMPETEGQPYGSAVCGCQSGGECDCADCDCKDCPCSTIRKSRTVESLTIKRSLIVDPVTGVSVGGPAIVMLSLNGCQPCALWQAQERPKYTRQGWEVPAPVFGAAAPVYPSFRIYDGKKWHAHNGWLSGDDVRRLLNGSSAASNSNPALEGSGAAVVRGPAAAVAHVSGRDWLIGGQPWTRRSLINHLATHSSHGHSLAQLQGMSFEQLNALHNADHESQRAPVRSVVTSSCPGGSCPPQAVRRRGLLGGWR